MPGQTAGSPYWAVVDFDSEGEEGSPSPNERVYLDPWDNQPQAMVPVETPESPEEGPNSLGEPVSGSFYYIPTKSPVSEEEGYPSLLSSLSPYQQAHVSDRQVYGRSYSRGGPDYYSDMAIYGERPVRERRKSSYLEEPMYETNAPIYEPLYGHLIPPPPSYVAPLPRSRISVIHYPEVGYGKHRRRSSRMTDAYDHLAYESMAPVYEDWSRPYPKSVPENFHLSKYGHLQIDYSFSWSTLDRLIRNK